MTTATLLQLRTILKQHGYQFTKAREITFGLLVDAEPQTLAQILQRADGRVDRVSIYRNLDLFERLGITHRMYIGWKYKIELTDIFTEHHHHLSCLQCGQIIDIADERHIDEFITQVAAQFGFQPRRHQFEIDGYCQNCQLPQTKQHA